MLGPLEVRTDGPGETLEVGGARLRALLIMLALRSGQLVPASQLIDGLWADDLPAEPAAVPGRHPGHPASPDTPA